MDFYKKLQLILIAVILVSSEEYEIKRIEIVQNPSYWDLRFLCPSD